MPPCSWTAATDQRRLRKSHRAFEEQAEQVAAAGAHLLAHDHGAAHAPILRDPSRRHRGVDPLVVGDRDDVQHVLALDPVEDLGDRGRAVRCEGVNVQIGSSKSIGRVPNSIPGGHRSATEASTGTSRSASARAPSSPRVADWSRSGQIGWKAPHHCSGPSARIDSKPSDIGGQSHHALAACPCLGAQDIGSGARGSGRPGCGGRR